MGFLANRTEAGRLLAAALQPYVLEKEAIVLGLARGGVPVAFEVAKTYRLPLDVLIVRKLGVPGQEELAMGAITNGGARIINHELVKALRLTPAIIEQAAAREMREIKRREALYRAGKSALQLEGKAIFLIDDGLATGSTMLAAIAALKSQKPKKIIAAVPVAPLSTYAQLREEVDSMLCLMTPEPFYGVGQWYKDFGQTTDAEVINLLNQASSYDLLLHGEGPHGQK